MAIHPARAIKFSENRFDGEGLARSGKRIPEAASFYNGSLMEHLA
jgi:hypothetical protein